MESKTIQILANRRTMESANNFLLIKEILSPELRNFLSHIVLFHETVEQNILLDIKPYFPFIPEDSITLKEYFKSLEFQNICSITNTSFKFNQNAQCQIRGELVTEEIVMNLITSYKIFFKKTDMDISSKNILRLLPSCLSLWKWVYNHYPHIIISDVQFGQCILKKLYAFGKYEEMCNFSQQYKSILKTRLNDSHDFVLTVQYYQTLCKFSLGQIDESLKICSDIISVCTEDQFTILIKTSILKGTIYTINNEYEKALDLFDNVLNLINTRLLLGVDSEPHLITLLQKTNFRKALTLSCCFEYEKALDLLRGVEDFMNKELGNKNGFTILVNYVIATVTDSMETKLTEEFSTYSNKRNLSEFTLFWTMFYFETSCPVCK